MPTRKGTSRPIGGFKRQAGHRRSHRGLLCRRSLRAWVGFPTRCYRDLLLVRMRRRHKDEKVEAFVRRIYRVEGHKIRERLGLGAVRCQNWNGRVQAAIRTGPRMLGTIDSCSDAACGNWRSRARAAALALTVERTEADEASAFGCFPDCVWSLVPRTRCLQRTSWPPCIRFQKRPGQILRESRLDERGLAHRLRQYGVRPKTIRKGAMTPRGYTKADLHDVWARYTPSPSELNETNKTNTTQPTTERCGACCGCFADYRRRARICATTAGARDTGNVHCLKRIWAGQQKNCTENA